jgi:hypothetical protein
MRKFAILSLFCFVAIAGIVGCNSADQKTTSAPKNSDLVYMNLRGKVNEIVESSTTIDSVGKSKADSLSNVYQFDEKGYQPKYLTKDSAGKVHTDQTISHDSAGHFTQVVTMVDGKLTYKLDVDMDKDGKYSGGKTYDSSGKQASYFGELVTNDYGIVTSGKEYFMNGKIKTTWSNKFDGANFTGGTSTDSTGKESYSGTIKLNDKGDPIDEVSTTREKDSTKTEKMTYKYDTADDQGNWTQRTTYNEKGKPTKVVKRTITYFKD